ncbi:MAG: hypothetical protein F4X51_03720 [Gemmatimonadetes bacterium]|nr:hypothetical protein [Gemmatimonadota bacterium]MYD61520.1 hypothetical protein [Gemmatimonadota bacterium]
MKIVVDEHIPLMTVQTLREMGHEVRDIRGTPDEGMHDDELWMMVQRQRCLLITTDKGFTQYCTVKHYGVLIIRLRQPNRHLNSRCVSRIETATIWRSGRFTRFCPT